MVIIIYDSNVYTYIHVYIRDFISSAPIFCKERIRCNPRMARLCRQFLALAALLSTCWVMANGVVNGDLVISKSERTIDATSHLVKIKTIFTVENTGTKAADHVHFVLDSKHADSLAYIGAVVCV